MILQWVFLIAARCTISVIIIMLNVVYFARQAVLTTRTRLIRGLCRSYIDLWTREMIKKDLNTLQSAEDLATKCFFYFCIIWAWSSLHMT